MPFEVRKISNYGTGHPVVARLKIQTHELLQWADLPKEKREAVTTLYFDMAERLLKCHEAQARLVAALKTATDEFRPSENPRVRNVPHVAGLRGEVETFLYEAKNYLRDLLGVIDLFFDKMFGEASAFYDPKAKGGSDLVVWATAQFGAADPFTTMLIQEQGWAGELIRKRNAVEHPGGKSGTLVIENFTPLPDGRFGLPRWHRDTDPPVGLFPDLETLLDNLLTLGEDMLVSCIHHRTRHEIIQFVQIPVAERQAECPQRITVQIDHSKLKPPLQAEPRVQA
jgi:hypothetical protein